MRLLVIAYLVFSLTPCAPAHAIDGATLLTNLKRQLNQALAVKQLDDNSITAFVMAMPGIPLDPDVKFDDPNDRQLLFKVLNIVPTGDISGQNSSDRMSDIYEHVLDGSEPTVSNPKQPQLQKEADDLKKKWTAMAEPYYRYKAGYLQAQADANTALATGDPAAKVKLARAGFAKAQWEDPTKGDRAGFEKTFKDWTSKAYDAAGGEPWPTWRTDFDDAKTVGFPVDTWPKYTSWAGSSGWTTLSFSDSDLQKSSSSSTVQVNGSAGFFGFGARGGGTTHVEVSSEELNKMSISLDLKRVVLFRDWLYASVFRSHKWKWKDPADSPISLGFFNKAKGVFEGRMPLLPTSLVLVRNVTLSGSWSKDFRETIEKNMSASGGWSFGPFSIGGGYANSSRNSNSRVQLSDSAIVIPDPQILGWYCDILPKSPDPQPPQ